MFNEMYDKDRIIENAILSVLSLTSLIVIMWLWIKYVPECFLINGVWVDNPTNIKVGNFFKIYLTTTFFVYIFDRIGLLDRFDYTCFRIPLKFLYGFWHSIFFIITIWQIFTLGSSSATTGGGISKSDTKSLKHTLNLRTNAKIQGREVDAEMHTNTATHQVLNAISSNSNNIEVKSTCDTMGHNVDLCTNARVQGRSLDAHIMENIVTNNAIDLLKK